MSTPNLDPATQADLAKLMVELSHNPKTRKEMGKLLKKAQPDSPYTTAFADVDLSDQFESFKQEQEQRELKRQQDEMLAQMNARRSALLTGGPDGNGRKYSEDDLKKIEDLMQKKGITDYEDGATLYAATLPPLDPKPGIDIPVQHGSTWEFPEWATFSTDPVKASRNAAHNVITEFMRKR